MNRFLSEENIALHKEYVRSKRLKYSIIESSLPHLAGKDVRDLYRMKLSVRDRQDAISLLSDVRLHEIFFSSFSRSDYPRSPAVQRQYGSEASFLNLLYKRCISQPYGFVLVYSSEHRIEIDAVSDFERAFRVGTPVLAIDTCEHAYFIDYGFDKERYLLSMLPYLDIARLTADTEQGG